MSYTPNCFAPGQILTADNMNDIEDGIFNTSQDIETLRSMVSDSGWNTLTLDSNFLPYAQSSTPQYRKYGPVVAFIGELKPASAGIAINSASSILVGVLPAGFRPAKRVRQICHGSGYNKYMLSVETNGNVYINRYGTTSGYAASITGNEWLPFNTTFMTA